MNPNENPYDPNSKEHEAFGVGYERSMSGARRSECLYTEPSLVEAFNKGFDLEIQERMDIYKDVAGEKVTVLSAERKRRDAS